VTVSLSHKLKLDIWEDELRLMRITPTALWIEYIPDILSFNLSCCMHVICEMLHQMLGQ
jgi:hypothetical protein